MIRSRGALGVSLSLMCELRNTVGQAVEGAQVGKVFDTRGSKPIVLDLAGRIPMANEVQVVSNAC